MKRYHILVVVLFIYMLFCCQPVSAQSDDVENYYPVGTKWVEVTYDPDPQNRIDYYNHYESEVVGDTVINGISWMLVKVDWILGKQYVIEDGAFHYFYPMQYYNLFRQEGTKIFRPVNQEPEMVLDFDWQVGNKIAFYDNGVITEESQIIQQQLADGKLYDCFGDNPMIIRTIGNTTEGLMFSSAEVTRPTHKQVTKQLCSFMRNGELIYSRAEPPLPTTPTGIAETCQENNHPSATFTLQGVKLKDIGQLPSGVYIQNGRKIMVK